MRKFINILGTRYSSVRTDHCENGSTFENPANNKSSGSSSIIDSFFHARKDGERIRYPKCVFVLLATGILSITAGVLSHIWEPYMLIFKWKLIFANNGEIFELWRTPPVDLYIKVYLFNVTNAMDFLKGITDKIRLEEVGPYVYRELLSHENVIFLENGTLSTTPSHPLVFQPHLSEGHTEEDIFYLPNIALLSIAQVASKHSYLFRLPLNLLIRQTKIQPLEKQTAKQFMFGYETTLTTLGNTFLPNWITFNKVGLIDRMYDFNDDFETFYTGATDESISGLYESYLGSPHLKQWNGEHCSNIRNASDGTKFKSFIKEDDKLLFFRKSMCRAQRMVQLGDDFEIDGLQATKYVFEENALDNGEINEKNKCFCRKGICLPRGLIDVTDCYYGFPIALSYPHFLDADPNLTVRLEGIYPNESQHSSFFMINSISGLPLRLSVKFQINMAMTDISNIAECERFSNIVLPTLWFEITMIQLPKSLRNRFLFYLQYLRILDRIIYYGLFTGGGVMLLFAIVRTSLDLSENFYRNHRISTTTEQSHGTKKKRHDRKNSILKNNKSKSEQGSKQEHQFLI